MTCSKRLRSAFAWITASLLPALAAAQSFPVSAIDPSGEGEFPGSRGPEQLIIYTPTFGCETTGTNPYGSEAVVRDHIVVSVGPNDSPIPQDGYVVSGHGAARNWINETLTPGTPVHFDEHEISVNAGPMGRFHSFHWRVDDLRRRLDAIDATEDERAAIESEVGGLDESWESLMRSEQYLATQMERMDTAIGRAEEHVWSCELARIPSPPGEIRGVWHRVDVSTEEEIEALVADLAEANVNVFFPETIYGSQAIYPDRAGLYPLREDLQESGVNALEVIVRECHARGIEVHAWVHVFYVGMVESGEEGIGLNRWPRNWLAADRRGRFASLDEPGHLFLSPADPGLRKSIIAAYVALVRRYQLDGLHLDYIRYPTSSAWERGWDYSDVSRIRVGEAIGIDPLEITPTENPRQWRMWLSWREQQITTFVAAVRRAVHAERPNVRITAAVFPGLDEAIEVKGQNWARWMRDGLVDDLFPMAYTTNSDEIESATLEVMQHGDQASPPVVGLAPFLSLSPRQLIEQIVAARTAGAQGECLFSWKSLTEAHRRALVAGPWRDPTRAVWSNPMPDPDEKANERR